MYEKKLSNQTFMKNNEEQVYDCICKLIPKVDPKKSKGLLMTEEKKENN